MHTRPHAPDPLPFNITGDTSALDRTYGLTEEIRAILDELYPEIPKGKKSTLNRLRRLCQRYPRIPHLKNGLAAAYDAAGNRAKTREINEWLVREHPDFIPGLVNKANDLLDNDRPGDIPAILGENLDLQALFPERDLFLIDEVLGYYSVAARYYLKIGEAEQAQDCLDLIRRLDPDATEIGDLKAEMALCHLQRREGSVRTEQIRERRVVSRKYQSPTKTSDATARARAEAAKNTKYAASGNPEMKATNGVLK